MQNVTITMATANTTVTKTYVPKVYTRLVKPQTNAELRKLIVEGDYHIGEIDVSAISDFTGVFKGEIRGDWDELYLWDIQAIDYNTMQARHIILDSMFEGSNINDTANFGAWFSADITEKFLEHHKIVVIDSYYLKQGAYSMMANKGELSAQELLLNKAKFGENQRVIWLESCVKDIQLPSVSARNMFKDCEWFVGSDKTGIQKWDMSYLVDATNMFNGAPRLHADVSEWGVGKLQDCVSFKCMFANCTFFNSKLTTWLVTNGTDYTAMFANCANFNQDVRNLGISHKTKSVDCMFIGCCMFAGVGLPISRVSIGKHSKYLPIETLKNRDPSEIYFFTYDLFDIESDAPNNPKKVLSGTSAIHTFDPLDITLVELGFKNYLTAQGVYAFYTRY